MESAVSLANTIHRAIRTHSNKKPSDVEMRAALQGYQASRLARVKEIHTVSWMLTRLQAYDGWLMYLVQRWVMPVLGLEFVAKQVAQTCSEAPKLDYLPFNEQEGTLGWKEKREARGKKLGGGGNQKKRGRSVEQILPVVFRVVLVLSSALWWFVAGESRHVLLGFPAVA